MTTEATEPTVTAPDCSDLWAGDFPAVVHTDRAAAACAHDYVREALELLEQGDVEEAVTHPESAASYLREYLDFHGSHKGHLPTGDLERAAFREIASDLERAAKNPTELVETLREAHRKLHEVFNDSGGMTAKGVQWVREQASEGDDSPDPTVELSDALIRPKEELTLLELAVMEAPNRGEEFADMLRWRIHDTRQKLEEAQERATERLQARRGKLNGGDSGE